MTRNATKLAAMLTVAQQRALVDAVDLELSRPAWRGLYPRLSVRLNVRARLQELGLLSRRPGHKLTKLGHEVRNILRGENHEEQAL